MSQDTVTGQGSTPNPEDETYLSLLKGTIKKKGIRVKIKKENAGLTTPHGKGPPDPSRETPTPDADRFCLTYTACSHNFRCFVMLSLVASFDQILVCKMGILQYDRRYAQLLSSDQIFFHISYIA